MKKSNFQIISFCFFVLFTSFSYPQKINKIINPRIEAGTVNSKHKIVYKVQDLPVPAIIYPSNSAVNIPIIPIFSFYSVDGADRYDIELSTDPYFSTIITDSYLRYAYPTAANETISFDPGIVSPDYFTGETNYYWRVMASMYDGSNSSPWSSAIMYTTVPGGTPLLAPSLNIPANGSTNSWVDLPLVWNIVDGAANYQVQYSTDANFNGFTYWYTYGTQSSISASIKPFQTYYWRVVGISPNSLSPFSNTNLFYTGDHAVLTQDQDTFDDGSGLDNYGDNIDLYWLIHPNDAKQIVLSFSSFSTESVYDYVTVYDGPTVSSPVLGKFSGAAIPSLVTSNSNNMLIRFTTDGSVNYSGWNADYYSILGNKLYPSLTISSGSISAGDAVNAIAQNMSTNGVVNFTLSGPGISSQSSVVADAQGNASTSFSIPIDAPAGVYKITASDVSSNRTAPAKYFNVSAIPATSNIAWVSSITDTIITNEQFSLVWTDQMILNPAYSVTGATREYSYSVESSSNGGTSWNPIKNVTGTGRINDWINISTNLSISNSGNYKIKVVDNKVNSRFIISNVFTVKSPPPINVNVSLSWDYLNSYSSFPTPAGVAADGVSRLYLNVSSSKNASLVRVTLSDSDGNNDIKTLGKVMAATITNGYSSEANNANTLTATETNANIDGKYWFWYVAPDNFIGVNPSDSTKTQKTVTAKIYVAFTDGTNLSKSFPITVVHPPLLLIHGLGGNGTTWNNFGYDNNGTKQLFVNDKPPLACAPSITNNSGFQKGGQAVKLECDKLLINTRLAGYAADQVFYVGHSMGGNYLRTFVSDPSFLSNLNYGQGYINKAVLLDSPQNGAPFADLVYDLIQIINVYLNQTTFDPLRYYYAGHQDAFNKSPWESLFKVNNLAFYLTGLNATDALLNLRTSAKGGQKLNQSNISAHLMAGRLLPKSETLDQIPPAFWDNISQIYDGYEILDQLASYLEILYPDAKHQAEGITNTTERTLIIYNYVISKYYGYSFIYDSDLIVPVASQLSGLNEDASNVTVFDNIIHTGNSELSVTSNTDVGTSVKHLLNSNINSPQFGPIPASVLNSKSLSSVDNRKKSFPSFGIKQDKIKITSIANGSGVFVDSVLNINFNIKDTTGLQYVKLYFQNKSYITYDKLLNQGFTVQVSGTYLKTQPIEILAVYYNNDSTYWSFDTSNVNVQTTSQLQKFFVEPKIMEIAVKQLDSPDYNAVYSSFLSKIESNDPDLTYSVSDPDVVSLSSGTNFITGHSKGETSVIISYKGLADTIYIVVNDTLTTGISDPATDKTIPVDFYLSQNYPNPFNPSTIIKYTVPYTELVKIKIYDILGKEIKTIVNEVKKAGVYTVEFKAGNMASGVYFYQLKSGNFISTKKMLLLK
jgi:hypothetical protein